MTTIYLVFVPLPEDRAELGEHIVRSAVCFFEAQGAAPARIDIGDFHRGARGGGAEIVKLVTIASTASAQEADDLGRALEGVLRSTLTAAKARAGDLRVFMRSTSDERAQPPECLS